MRGEHPTGPPTGNLLLDALFGAEVLYAGTEEWAQLAATVEAVAEERAHAYTLPAGGSSPVGALGFVAAYAELLGQLEAVRIQPQRVYHASTSGGTHAGLMLGHALARGGPRPVGRGISPGVDRRRLGVTQGALETRNTALRAHWYNAARRHEKHVGAPSR